MQQKIYDIIIAGAGPAGLTAAVYARRAGKSVLLIEKEALVMEEANAMTQENFQLPKQYKTDDEFFDSLIKEHILHKHPKVIGDYFGEYRFSSHAGTIHFEHIYNKEEVLGRTNWLDSTIQKIMTNELYKGDFAR